MRFGYLKEMSELMKLVQTCVDKLSKLRPTRGVRDTQGTWHIQNATMWASRTLVDPENILFSVLNITDRPVRVDKNATVAALQSVDIVEPSIKSVDVSSELPENLQVLYKK